VFSSDARDVLVVASYLMSSFLTLSALLIFNDIRRHTWCATSSCSMRVGGLIALNTRFLVDLFMLRCFHSLTREAQTCLVLAILRFTSSCRSPSCVNRFPRYMKEVTKSMLPPFSTMGVGGEGEPDTG
jgi:hypothetical protein